MVKPWGRLLSLRFLLAAAALSSLAFSVVLVLEEPSPPPEPAAADSFTSGPLGHKAFLEFLRALGVRARRFRSPRGAAPWEPLFLLEPRREALLGGRTLKLASLVRARVEEGKPVVLVLPKWKWVERERRFEPLPLERVSSLLEEVFPRAAPPPRVVRGNPSRAGGPIRLPGGGGMPSLTVELPPPVQALSLQGCGQPLLGRPGFCLAAGFPDRAGPFYVVADPDLLHNFNLARADHGAFWAAFLERILEAREVYLDEVFHGHGRIPSLADPLRRFPGTLLLVQGILLLLGMGWASLGRFGPPAEEGAPAEGGTRLLVEVSGRLLEEALRGGDLAREYVEWILRDTADRLRVRPWKDPVRLAEELDRSARLLGRSAAAGRALREAREKGGGMEEAWAFRMAMLGREEEEKEERRERRERRG